ncbi:MAG: hypothetical protein HQK52_14965 [Oligoflexia bacterium]|nr:hypothetical protein [Oligoflexia bacterium]
MRVAILAIGWFMIVLGISISCYNKDSHATANESGCDTAISLITPELAAILQASYPNAGSVELLKLFQDKQKLNEIYLQALAETERILGIKLKSIPKLTISPAALPGFFSSQENRINISPAVALSFYNFVRPYLRGSDDFVKTLQALMSHELTHAIQDQEVPGLKYFTLLQKVGVESFAVYVQAQTSERLGVQYLFDILVRVLGAEESLKQMDNMSSKEYQFMFVLSDKLASKTIEHFNGDKLKALKTLLKLPPTADEQVSNPDKYIAHLASVPIKERRLLFPRFSN